MSQKELDRLAVIQQVIAKQLSQLEAASQLKLSTRQVRNLQRRYQQRGTAGLASIRRGKPSNNRLDELVRQQAIELISHRYADFGPTLAHEKLTERHQLKLSVESTRQLMLKAGLWQGKQRKPAKVHPQRARRACLGELVQIDGSPHAWFEERGPACCLLVFIDDATSRLMQLHFTEVESTEAYFTATQAYLKQHGRPLAFYSDKHSIFRINTPEAHRGTGETQFGRALRELEIELICAHSPQAKGRVERANSTLQDRLVKELRLQGIADIESANAFLPQFIETYNKRFAVESAQATNAHRLTLPDEATLCLIFSQQFPRKVSKNLEISYQNVIYQIQSNTPRYTLRGATLTVCDKKGEITLRYKQQPLTYKTFDKHNRPARIVDNKQLQPPKTVKPKANHPWRQYEKTAQCKVQLATQV